MSKLPLRASVLIDDWLVISGQIGIQNGTLADGVADQTRQALLNLDNQLKTAGFDRSNVVKTTVFLTEMADYSEMNGAYADYFHTQPPARSAIAVKALPLGAAVEIEAWAHLGASVAESPA